MSFQITNFIAFQVTDYEKAIAFYTDILGFELVKQTDKECKMRKGDFTFYIEKKSEGPLFTFFEFATPDIAAAKAKLLEAGCTITMLYSDNNMMMLDPYGFRFHVYQQGIELGDI